jgi:hypothetical protein
MLIGAIQSRIIKRTDDAQRRYTEHAMGLNLGFDESLAEIDDRFEASGKEFI